MSKVFEKDNFLTQGECNLLINYQKRHSANDIQKWSLKDHDSNWNSRTVTLNKLSIQKQIADVSLRNSINGNLKKIQRRKFQIQNRTNRGKYSLECFFCWSGKW